MPIKQSLHIDNLLCNYLIILFQQLLPIIDIIQCWIIIPVVISMIIIIVKTPFSIITIISRFAIFKWYSNICDWWLSYQLLDLAMDFSIYWIRCIYYQKTIHIVISTDHLLNQIFIQLILTIITNKQWYRMYSMINIELIDHLNHFSFIVYTRQFSIEVQFYSIFINAIFIFQNLTSRLY